MKTSDNLVKRILFCAVGMFFYASGVAFTKNCNMGISPIVSVAYVLSLLLPVSMGWCTTIVNFVFFGIQKALLKDEYPLWMMGAQLLMSVIFSIYIDAAAVVWRFVQPSVYPLRLATFIFGCLVLAIGVVMVVTAHFVVLPAEGTVNALVKATKMKFGNAKILFDGSMVTTTLIISLAAFHSVKGIREGTLIAILLVGTFSKMIGPHIGKLAKSLGVIS